MTITEFLTARLDEIESAARAAAFAPWEAVEYAESEDHVVRGGYFVEGAWPAGRSRFEYDQGDPSDPVEVVETLDAATADHIALNDPVRVLADVAAKRAIVARLAEERGGWNSSETNGLGDEVLRMLVQPYAEHPDFDGECRS